MSSTLSASPPSFYTKPAPKIRFSGRHFCFTGDFEFGFLQKCQEEVVNRNGKVEDRVTKNTSYLVVGKKGSSKWIYPYHYGRKIEKAMAMQDRGLPIAIVKEQHWRKLVTAA